MSEAVRDAAWGEVQHHQTMPTGHTVEVRKLNDRFNVFVAAGSEHFCVGWQEERATAGATFKQFTKVDVQEAARDAWKANKDMWS